MSAADEGGVAMSQSWLAAGWSTQVTLQGAEFVPFHRIEVDERWTLVGGAPVRLHLIHADGRYEVRLLQGTETVEAGALRAARLDAAGEVARCIRQPLVRSEPPIVALATADEILREHPLHEAVVRALTRA